MSIMRFVAPIIAILLIFGAVAHAEIKKADLNKPVVLTERAALLTQVDTVSLYLSSDRVALAPRLTKDGVIDVEMTVLAPDLQYDRGRLQAYAQRLIRTFTDVLAERLPVYAPAVAKTFDAKRDVRFEIDAGAGRTPMAVWTGGAWGWKAGAPVASGTSGELNTARAMDAAPKACNCPARR